MLVLGSDFGIVYLDAVPVAEMVADVDVRDEDEDVVEVANFDGMHIQ